MEESDDSEDVGMTEPAKDDMTDTPLLLGGALREELRWVSVWSRGIELPCKDWNITTLLATPSLVVRGEKFPTLTLPPIAKERGA